MVVAIFWLVVVGGELILGGGTVYNSPFKRQQNLIYNKCKKERRIKAGALSHNK